jgi:FMN phosphatase YigB (HAD superfamily)
MVGGEIFFKSWQTRHIMNCHYKVALFDLDDVLVIDNDYKTDLAREYDVSIEHVRRVMKHNPLVDAYKSGKLLRRNFYPAIIDLLGVNISPDQLIGVMSKSRLDEKVLHIMQVLDSWGVRLGALTDANPDRVDFIDRQTGLKGLFYPELFITSYSVGALKPDRRMFQAGLAAAKDVAGASPCEVVVIDDKLSFISALADMDFDGQRCHGIHYTGDVVKLQQALYSLAQSK